MHAVIWLAPATFSVLALLDLPYGYFIFLRVAVCLSATFIAYSTWTRGPLWGAAFAALAILFNPIFRVHLDRETWQPINLLAAALYIAHWWFVGRASKTPP